MQQIPRILLLAVISLLIGCGGGTPRLDQEKYSPVIDFYQYDTDQNNTDISKCRELAITAQEKYDLQRAEEKAKIFASSVEGAAVGNALDYNNDSATTIGAFNGAGIGAASTAEAYDYNRVNKNLGQQLYYGQMHGKQGISDFVQIRFWRWLKTIF